MAIRIRKRHADETARLFAIWHSAVCSTHGFLSPADFETIAGLVRDHYLPEAELWVAIDEQDQALAFMGMTASKAEALFVDPARHGEGIGRALMAHAEELAGPLTVDVNAQNDAALAFYRRLGFVVTGRSETDAGGMPYPLLHLAAPGR